MSTTRYLDFDSTYRNRNCYPCPADFKVNITCSKSSNEGGAANDFVSKDYPNYSWYQVPYAGFDLNTFVSYNLPIEDGTNSFEIKENIIKNGRIINGILYPSLWPVCWNDGTYSTYSSQYGGASSDIPTTGAFGTRFDISITPTEENYWNDIVIRNQNISCPQNFSGGTSEQPQLGMTALSQGIVNNYFTGALLFKFKQNPIIDMVNYIPDKYPGDGTTDAVDADSRPPIGSLGFPFYYQKLFLKDASNIDITLGCEVTQGTNKGYIACIVNDKELLVRLGDSDPFTSKWYPPWKSDYANDKVFDGTGAFDTTNTIKIDPNSVYTPPPLPLSVDLELLSVGEVFQTYLYCGNVESSVITKYNKDTSTATLSSPFNDFNPGNGEDFDYYLVDFNNDPTSYWRNIQDGAPRIFFPTGANIENYYTGTELSDVDILKNQTTNSFSKSVVKSYDSNRRTLYLDNKFHVQNPKVYCEDTYSAYTILYLDAPLERKIPRGSIIYLDSIQSNDDNDQMNYVTVESPEGSNTIILEGISNRNNRLLSVTPGFGVKYILPPPYYDKDLYNYWKQYNEDVCNGATPITTLNDSDGCISFGSRIGSSSIIQRNQRTSSSQINIPYVPLISTPTSLSPSFFIRNNCVFEIELSKPGCNYKVTKPNKPILALLAKPTSYTPPFEGWRPSPEKITSKERTYNGEPVEIYTFLNICFVNIEAVDSTGGIVSLSVNSPGSGYPRNSRVFIMDGNGDDIDEKLDHATQTWIPGCGYGAEGIVTCAYQTIGVPGAPSNFSLPDLGDAVYLPNYGWSRKDKDIYNSAPNFGNFYINYNKNKEGQDFVVKKSELPRTIQNCLNDQTTLPETGVRIIEDSFESCNSQVLINTIYGKDECVNRDQDDYPVIGQYSAPACYLNNIIDNDEFCDSEKINRIIWIGLREGYDTINLCDGEYAIARDEFVNYDYAWGYPETVEKFIPPNDEDCCNDNSGGFVNHRKENPNILNYPYSGAANILEILKFTKDNEYPLNYTGTTVSQNQMVCYEIELLSLILPNVPLDNNIGGLIAFYPYVYVELSNVSDPNAGIKGVLYSNNPNAQRALFRVGITDTPTPLISSFIKVAGNRSVQTVKFKPNDILHFRVYLSNGELFETLLKDNAPPLEPNPFVQISATFAIKRLV